MFVTKVRRSGWSGWLVDRELNSPSAESAFCAALIVAVTWSSPSARAVDETLSPAICAVGAKFGSERTDISRECVGVESLLTTRGVLYAYDIVRIRTDGCLTAYN